MVIHTEVVGLGWLDFGPYLSMLCSIGQRSEMNLLVVFRAVFSVFDVLRKMYLMPLDVFCCF